LLNKATQTHFIALQILTSLL